MSCELTATLVVDYLDDGLADDKRQHYDEHLALCAQCREQFASLGAVYNTLQGWQIRSVPEWPRHDATTAESARLAFRGSRLRRNDEMARGEDGPGLVGPRFRGNDGGTRRDREVGGRSHAGARFRRRSVLQWLPLAASLLLAVAVVTQTRIDVDDTGWALTFGAPATQPSQSTGSAVTRPDPDSVREVYALSLDAGEPPLSAVAQPNRQTDFESQVFAAMCDSANLLQLPQDGYVTLVIMAPDEASSRGARGERMHRLSRNDLQACQRGDINAATLQQRAVDYSY